MIKAPDRGNIYMTAYKCTTLVMEGLNAVIDSAEGRKQWRRSMFNMVRDMEQLIETYRDKEQS